MGRHATIWPLGAWDVADLSVSRCRCSAVSGCHFGSSSATCTRKSSRRSPTTTSQPTVMQIYSGGRGHPCVSRLAVLGVVGVVYLGVLITLKLYFFQ